MRALADVAHRHCPGCSTREVRTARALRTLPPVGQSVIAGGARVSAETSRRLACDAGRVVMTCDEHGNTLSVGRRTRTVPTAIRRALEHRDDRCRFPGCDMRHCDAHHIVHWADGGSTALDNLVLLCRRHHRAVHDGGFRVGRSPAGDVQFHHRDGRRLPAVPDAPPLHGDLATMHEAEGLQVDSGALITFASGQPLDLHTAVLTLRGTAEGEVASRRGLRQRSVRAWTRRLARTVGP